MERIREGRESREQSWVYMVSSSEAKRAASAPPAPGRISMRAGRVAKGWGGRREVFRVWVIDVRVEVVAERSAEAREWSSGSVVGSWMRE
jgi:hypothetical protein